MTATHMIKKIAMIGTLVSIVPVSMSTVRTAGTPPVVAGTVRVTAVRSESSEGMLDFGRLYRAARREIAEHFEQIVDAVARPRSR